MNPSDRADTILAIAKKLLKLPTLETRRSDRLDFHDLAVWQIQEALEAAYNAGFKAAGGQMPDPSE